MKPTTIQSYLFDRQSWTVSKAKAWLKSHRKVMGVVTEGAYLHARQIDSDLFDRRSLRTVDLSLRLGIRAVVGHLQVSHIVRRK